MQTENTYDDILKDYEKYLLKSNIKTFTDYIGAAKTLLTKIKNENILLKHLSEKYIELNYTYQKTVSRLKKFIEYLKVKNIISEEKGFLLNNKSISFDFALKMFCLKMKNKKRAIETIDRYIYCLKIFNDYLTENSILNLGYVNRKTIEYFKVYLYNKTKLTNNTRSGVFKTLKPFFRFLKEEEYIKYDPAFVVKGIKRYYYLNQNFFTKKEIERFFNNYSLKISTDKRMYCMFFTSYFLGLRISEVLSLKTDEIDFTNNLIYINESKNKDSRVLPILNPLDKILNHYIATIRPNLFDKKKIKNVSNYLFINSKGKKLADSTTHLIFLKEFRKLKLNKTLSFHSFRNSIATHLLKNDMNIRYIQKYLGHNSINSTAEYIKVVPDDLKKVINKYHPGANDEN